MSATSLYESLPRATSHFSKTTNLQLTSIRISFWKLPLLKRSEKERCQQASSIRGLKGSKILEGNDYVGYLAILIQEGILPRNWQSLLTLKDRLAWWSHCMGHLLLLKYHANQLDLPMCIETVCFSLLSRVVDTDRNCFSKTLHLRAVFSYLFYCRNIEW